MALTGRAGATKKIKNRKTKKGPLSNPEQYTSSAVRNAQKQISSVGAEKPKPEERKVWKESAGSERRRKFLKIGAALAEMAGGTDYAKEAASGEPLKIGKKDKKKKKDKHGGKALTVTGVKL